MSLSPQQFPEIRREDLSTPDARRSRGVSSEEFQRLAAKGERQYTKRANGGVEPRGLDEHFEHVVEHAHKAVQEPWGGATYNARTGRPLASDADAYALTARTPGMRSVEVPVGSHRDHFNEAMKKAREEYDPVLKMKGAHLGVFHDADKGTVDIDPVMVVKKKKDVESIGAYTHATGGAYHFKSGNGYWPPHVSN